MGLKIVKPLTPASRGMILEDFSEITEKKPKKSLTRPLKRCGGRNSSGRITVRHRGGGHKRLYRIIDFKRDKIGIKAKVESIQYDPNRSAHIALLKYEDGEERYIICPLGLKPGDEVISGPDAPIKTGNALPLERIPDGTLIHNIELIPGRGAKLCRSAGNWSQLLSKEGDYAILKLPSQEIRKVPLKCYATIGQVGNIDHENISLGKAGKSRHRGRRPVTRGVAMRPVDHPHGGGKGKGKGGNLPRSFSNVPCKGYRTRRRHWLDWLIIKRRGK